jgi:plastocyanin
MPPELNAPPIQSEPPQQRSAFGRLARIFRRTPRSLGIALVIVACIVAIGIVMSLNDSQPNTQSNSEGETTALTDKNTKDLGTQNQQDLNQTSNTETAPAPAPLSPELAPSPTPPASSPAPVVKPSPPPPAPAPSPMPAPTPAPPTKSFTINSYSYGYSPNSISVSPGDKVTITLTNSGGKHDLVIDELGVNTSTINSGQSTSVTFTVPQSAAGQSYEFYCSIGSHRAQGMVGIVNVTD